MDRQKQIRFHAPSDIGAFSQSDQTIVFAGQSNPDTPLLYNRISQCDRQRERDILLANTRAHGTKIPPAMPGIDHNKRGRRVAGPVNSWQLKFGRSIRHQKLEHIVAPPFGHGHFYASHHQPPDQQDRKQTYQYDMLAYRH